MVEVTAQRRKEFERQLRGLRTKQEIDDAWAAIQKFEPWEADDREMQAIRARRLVEVMGR